MLSRVIYFIVWILLLPIYTLFTVYRTCRGKEDPKRLLERIAYTNTTRPQGNLIWFHAASVGESLAILPLIEKIHNHHKETALLITTGTKTSADLMKEKLPSGVIHQYAPWDFYPCVARFMKKWQPSLSVFVESEFWPELICQAPKPMLINGRISDRSYPKYKKYKKYITPLLNKFTLLLAQDSITEERLRTLSETPVLCSGNLKFDAPITAVSEELVSEFKKNLSNRPVWVISSTHHDEETQLLPVLNALKKTFPDLFTIIAPRHPHRGEHIERIYNDAGYKTTRRGKQKTLPLPNDDVYIADTIGEMSLWYTLANIVFIGGSFIPHGGQNPYEPIKRGKIVLCGPHMFNFKTMMQLFKQRGVILQVDNVEKLTQDIKMLLKDTQITEKTEAHIQSQMHDLGGATEYTYLKLKDLTEGWSYAQDKNT